MGQKKVSKKRAPLEEEDEQLTHHEQEQESHNQEPAKQTPACKSSEDEDEDEEEQDEEVLEVEEEQKVEKNKSSVQKPITLTKPQHPRSSDSDPGSDMGSPTASGSTIKPVSPQPKKPTSGKRVVPEFERKGDETSRKKKKAKVFEEAAEKRKSGVGAIKRLWSEEDEVLILERLMNFKSSNMGGLYKVIKEFLSVNASRSQFVHKIFKLKGKYIKNVERGDKAVLSVPHERKCFELSKKIWGGGKENNNGGDGNGKSVGKKTRRTFKRNDAVDLPDENDGKESALGEENKADKVGDFWATHPCLKQSLEMEMKEPVKSIMMENMSMIGDLKAKELEKKWKDFFVDEVGLYLKQVKLSKVQAKLVYDTMKASKD